VKIEPDSPAQQKPHSMSKTKAEIEAEIARLRAKLEHVEIDPAFTPAELVRWDPSLLGAVLHIKHYDEIPEIAFDVLAYHRVPERSEPIDANVCYGRSWSNVRNDPRNRNDSHSFEALRVCASMANVGVLTLEGCVTSIKLRNLWASSRFASSRSITNNFTSVAKCIRALGESGGPGFVEFKAYHIPENPGSPGWLADLSCKKYEVTLHRIKLGNPHRVDYTEVHIPLADPERFLLDQIFVATSISVRIHEADTDIIVDKYPLSTLYQEWRRDKEAARGAPPLRRTELDKAKAQIAELQVQMRLLFADREADREATREAVLIADQAKAAELIKQNERLREALHIAVQTTNATASTDPM